MSLLISELDVFFGETQVLYEIDLEIENGEFFSVLGGDACGKSTLLRAIAGLVKPRAGRIHFDGEAIDLLPPDARGVSAIFQDLRMFPRMNVLENIAFPLRFKNMNADARVAAADRLLGELDLRELSGAHPNELSAYDRQRVLIARALISEPRLLLLDEPFALTEAPLRGPLRLFIRDMSERMGVTVIMATNNHDDAIMLSDRIAFMLEGEIMQCDTPDQIYNYPGTLDIAKYFCNGNTLPGRVNNGRFESGTVLLSAPGLPDGSCMAMIRPGIISVALDPGEFEVAHVEYLGDFQRLYVKRNDCSLNFVTDLTGEFKKGDMIDIRITDGKALFYR